MRLIDADALYERATTLEAQALDYVGKLIERDGDEPSVEWKIWSAILAERTAFKHDLMDAPTVDAVEVVKQAFSGEMKLMPAEDALFANPYKTVLEDLKQVPMFTGKYDAKNGNIHFMYGISTVLEYIADKAGDEEYEGMFLDNLNKSAYGDKAE